MDVSAYLKKQGWRGAGHSLDHTNRGIKKPLQVSRKIDALGVGLQKHAAVSDQWWLRAYDQGLKDLGTGKESSLATAQKHGVNRGGLYARFVKGTAVPGTIGKQVVQDSEAVAMARPNPEPYSHPLDATENFAPDQSVARKRQMKESAAEVRARRRAERIQREKDNTARKLSRAGFNLGAVERPKSELDHIRHKVKGFVDEAMRRGVIAPRRTTKPVRSRAVAPSSQDMDAVLELAQLPPWKAKTSPKAEKIQREKMIRDLKRAVIKYLENTTVSPEELEAAKAAEEQFKQQRKEAREAHRENVKLEKERRVEAKKERRAKKKATLLAAKRQAMNNHTANGDGDGFKVSADEIKLDDPELESVSLRKIPGMGYVDKYPTKAEKRATKLQAEALEQGISVAEVEKQHEVERIRKEEEHQMQIYRTNAAKKGMALEEYMEQQRQKKEERLQRKNDEAEPVADAGFIVDTTGDATIALDPEAPVPLDPNLWKGKVVKELPKNIRKARRDWMAQRRAERKGTSVVTAKKAKGIKKVATRESFVKQILNLSRDANRKGDLDAKVTVNGIENVPVLKLEQTEGSLSKAEVAKARTLARKMIKLEKQESRGRTRG